jgi:hypothetical protein
MLQSHTNPALRGSSAHYSEDDNSHQVGEHLHNVGGDEVKRAAQYLRLRNQNIGKTEEISARPQTCAGQSIWRGPSMRCATPRRKRLRKNLPASFLP